MYILNLMIILFTLVIRLTNDQPTKTMFCSDVLLE